MVFTPPPPAFSILKKSTVSVPGTSLPQKTYSYSYLSKLPYY
jgi:hypothetical protein